MIGGFMIEIFLNDLLVNSVCGKDRQYVENKRKEWIFLRQALKTKSVTPISDRRFFLLLTIQRYAFFQLHFTFLEILTSQRIYFTDFKFIFPDKHNSGAMHSLSSSFHQGYFVALFSVIADMTRTDRKKSALNNNLTT
jgi:hypothetical protein